LEWRRPEELAENPANWRAHPAGQTAALAGALAEVGWAGAVLYNERTGRLIDGHARRKLPPELLVDGRLPVLVGSWNEEQEQLILATLDPLAAMAETDAPKLAALLRQVDTDSEALRPMLAALRKWQAVDHGWQPGSAEGAGPDNWGIYVECQDEREQRQLLERLHAEGYQCRGLVG
jgi:hypothetical protein